MICPRFSAGVEEKFKPDRSLLLRFVSRLLESAHEGEWSVPDAAAV